jgi:hypothetical protein
MFSPQNGALETAVQGWIERRNEKNRIFLVSGILEWKV